MEVLGIVRHLLFVFEVIFAELIMPGAFEMQPCSSWVLLYWMLTGNPVLQTRYHVLLPRCPIQTSCHPSRGVLFSLNIKVLLLACQTTQQCKIVINTSNRPRSSQSHRGASQHHLCLIWKHKHPGNKKQATESHVAYLCEYQLQLKISWFMDICYSLVITQHVTERIGLREM